MSLDRSVWSRHAVLLASAGALLIANLGFFLWYRSTARERRDALEARRTSLAREVEAVEQEAAHLARQRDRLSQVSAAIGEFYGKRVGARKETLAPVVEEIHSIFRTVGISPAQISYATKPLQDIPLAEMSITFSFKSDYARFKQILGLLESDRRWIVIRDVALSRDTEATGSVLVRMSLATYFSGEEGSAAPLVAPRVSLSQRPRR